MRILSLAVLLLSASIVHADDLQTVRDRYVASIIPRGDADQKSILDLADKHIQSQRSDGSWPDIDFADPERTYWPARLQLQRALVMAKAMQISQQSGKLDENVKTHTLAALAFWLDHDFQNMNWWWNQIGVPQLIGEIGLLVEAQTTPETIARCTKIMKRSTFEKWTGQNLVWGAQIEIVRGCLEHSPDAVAHGFGAMYGVIRIAGENEEGIQSDFSFHQHGQQFYSGGYGLNFAFDATRFASFAWGTKFQIPEDREKILASYVLDGEQWMIRGVTFDFSAVGREIARQGKTAVPRSWTTGPIAPQGAAYSLMNGIDMLGNLTVPRQEEFRRFAGRLHGEKVPDLVGNRHFWKSDYMAHRRAGYLTSVRMFSTRLLNTEETNKEGRKSQHLADGANYLYLTGDEYRDIFPTWDWTKVPGTTAEQGTLDIEKPRAIGVKGKTSFVGGVSDGTYGLAAVDLVRGKLSARKVWVFFDDEYVCLGSGITCTTDNNVATTVNQCLLKGEVTKGANWVHHDSVGYLFPTKSEYQMSAKPQSGSWSDIGTSSTETLTRDVFTLWVEHGARCSGATYAYTVLPGATAQQTDARAQSPDVQLISNTRNLTAVFHPKLKIFAAAFGEAGEVKFGDGRTIEVNQPCLVMIRDSKISVSNPQNMAGTINLRLDGKTHQIELPTGLTAGSTALP